jgi:replicative DNA helicase
MSYNKNNHRNAVQLHSIDPNYAHVQPQATEIERAVLGALMIDKNAILSVGSLLKPESFYEPRNQKVYSAIIELSMHELPVDILTVTEQLARQGDLEAVGGPSYVTELSSSVASSVNVEYHARIIAQKYLLREVISLSSNVQTQAFDETTDVDDMMQYLEASVFDLAKRDIKQDYVGIIVAVKEADAKMMQAYSNKGELTGIPTGYLQLDETTRGWQNSDFIIIAGRPSMGKTAFALSMLKNMAVDRKIPSAFFSLEMSRVQLAQRLMSNVTDIKLSQIIGGQLSPSDLEQYDKHLPSLLDAPIYIDDTPGLSLMELRTKARRLVREHGVKIIFVDYLQLMNANGTRFFSRQEEVSIISRSLKGLAKELNLPVIALSQLNRGVENREGLEGKRPQLSDLRESGSIEQDADMVLLVHRPEYYRIYNDDNGRDMHGMAQIIIAKQRQGATGDVLLTFRGEFTRFENPEDKRLKKPNNSNSSEITDEKISEDMLGESSQRDFSPF